MPYATKPSEGRYVKGGLIIDYVKMIRSNPQLPWAEHLAPEELEEVQQLILPASWYPLELFQRIGLATFKLIAKENYQVIRLFGRASADRMNAETPGLVSPGRARDTLRKYRLIQDRLYSFRPVQTDDLAPQHLLIHTYSLPEETAARLIMEIVAGTVERLIELSGGRNIQTRLIEAVWEGAGQNTLEVTWEEG